MNEQAHCQNTEHTNDNVFHFHNAGRRPLLQTTQTNNHTTTKNTRLNLLWQTGSKGPSTNQCLHKLKLIIYKRTSTQPTHDYRKLRQTTYHHTRAALPSRCLSLWVCCSLRSCLLLFLLLLDCLCCSLRLLVRLSCLGCACARACVRVRVHACVIESQSESQQHNDHHQASVFGLRAT